MYPNIIVNSNDIPNDMKINDNFIYYFIINIFSDYL